MNKILSMSSAPATSFAQRTVDRSQAERLFEQGLTAEKAGDTKTALALYHEAVMRYPQHAAWSWYNIGYIWQELHNNLRMAETFYREATIADPQYVKAYESLGAVLDLQGKFEAALVAYNEALKIDPLHADVHYNLACTYQSYRKHREAVEHFRRYLEYQKDDDERYIQMAQKAIEVLSALLNLA
jgi:tetratricopeptide (TPR) repeat protein